jgi:hypothetical protein
MSKKKEDKMKRIIPLYIESLGIIHCNELRFIVEKFLEDNPEYKPKKRDNKAMVDWINNREVWEECSSNIQILTFDKEPIETNSSLHIYEEKYLVDGETYRLLYTIGDNSPPTVEKLKKKSKKFNQPTNDDT